MSLAAWFIALSLDLLLGDPPTAWHPVRVMGSAVRASERLLRWSGLPLREGGMLLALSLTLGAGWAGWAVLQGAAALGLGSAVVIVEGLLFWACFSVKDMLVHAKRVLVALLKDDLAQARVETAKMVGRDVEHLEEPGLSRACVESVAEGTCDAVLGPFFWAALGGAPAALAYRMLNTLDSMVGYKDERYADLGWASARLDDLANWVPARFAAFFIGAAAVFTQPGPGGRLICAIRAWATARRDGPLQPSPNAGWPEGAFAGALGVQLGGPASYRGAMQDKARLGRPLTPLNAGSILAACRLYAATALLAALALSLASRAFSAEDAPRAVTLSAVDGLDLHASLWPGPTGADRVIVVAPGFGQHSGTRSFIAVAKHLSPLAAVLVLDFRGNGKSQGSFQFGAEEHKDLGPALDWAAKAYPHVSLLGFSLGAYSAVRTLAETASRPERVMLVSCPTKVDAIIWSGGTFLQPLMLPFEAWRAKVKGGNDFLFSWGWVFRSKPNAAELAGQIKVPAYFLTGSRDWLVFPRLSHKVHRAWAGPRNWTEFEKGGHAERMFHFEPERFVAWVAAAMDGRLILEKL